MAHTTDSSFVLRPGEGRSIDLGNFAMSLKASGEDTAGGFALLEAAEPPDFGPPLHIHRDAAEAFYILEGEYHVFIEEQAHRCPTGSFIYIPAGLRHGFRVGAVASRKLNLYSPAAMVGYFDQLSAALARRGGGSGAGSTRSPDPMAWTSSGRCRRGTSSDQSSLAMLRRGSGRCRRASSRRRAWSAWLVGRSIHRALAARRRRDVRVSGPGRPAR